MAMYLFVFVFLFALGLRKAPMFFILSGIVGITFAIELWNLLSSTILTTVLAGVSVMIIVFGFVARPSEA